MATPKSAKLLQSENELTNRSTIRSELILGIDGYSDGPVLIREIPCLNDFVAILVSQIRSDIALPETDKFKNEGVVVGVGPGLPDNHGGRVASQLSIGDRVLFSIRSIAAEVSSDKAPYQGKRVILVSEKSLLCKLPPEPFEIVK